MPEDIEFKRATLVILSTVRSLGNCFLLYKKSQITFPSPGFADGPSELPLAVTGEQPGQSAVMRRGGPPRTTFSQLLRDREGAPSPPVTASHGRQNSCWCRRLPKLISDRPRPSGRGRPSVRRPGPGVFTAVRFSPSRAPRPATRARSPCRAGKLTVPNL